MRTYYPVTLEERCFAARRGGGCTMAVRESVTFGDRTFPLLAYGSPTAYEYKERDGLTYGVFRHEDDGDRVYMPAA